MLFFNEHKEVELKLNSRSRNRFNFENSIFVFQKNEKK